MTNQYLSSVKSAARARILVVDAQPLLRHGLASLINADLRLSVCAEADEPRKAMAALCATQPDLVITDVTLTGKGGIELIKDIIALYPELPVLVFSTHPEVEYVERALFAGARGYALKSYTAPKLLEAIYKVLAGKLYVAEEVSAHLLEHRYNNSIRAQRDPFIGKLSDRELQVLDLIGTAKSSREIADALIISIKTVESHRANIKQKLGLQTAQELTRAAVRWVESRRTGNDLTEAEKPVKPEHWPHGNTTIDHGLSVSSFVQA
ncbi:MAG: response regulator transcription factor [Rhodospirillales bacterium]|nr:response regulator transcription factor [Acetobacter sp.]